MAPEIAKDIFLVGINNPDGRDFHGISTPRGGSYNSYLIKDEKPTLIDATNTKFTEKYLESLRSIINPEKIKYIIINHAENDHTGAIVDIKKACPNAKIVCTKKCMEFVKAAFNLQAEFIITEEVNSINIGQRNINFIIQPMIHWPETMMTYIKEDKILFSCDLFGTEISHESIFADEMQPFVELTRDYFTAVMRPFAFSVIKAIEKIKDLELKILAPSHGPVYRKNINSIIEYYKKLATEPEENKVMILYYSIWEDTEKIAQRIKENLSKQNKNVVMYNIYNSNWVELMAQSLTSKVLVVGSLTIISDYHPLFNAFFSYIKWNNQKNKKVFAYGTYGWVSASTNKLASKLTELEYDVIDILDLRFGPVTSEDYKKIDTFSNKILSIIDD